MAATITSGFNIYIKKGDAFLLTLYTNGSAIDLDIGDAAILYIRESVDSESIALQAEVVISTTNTIQFNITTEQSETIPVGKYVWGVKVIKALNEYIIVPVEANQSYPKFIVRSDISE